MPLNLIQAIEKERIKRNKKYSNLSFSQIVFDLLEERLESIDNTNE